jgi:hypothetical protein
MQMYPRCPVMIFPDFNVPQPFEAASPSGIVSPQRSYVFSDYQQLEKETIYDARGTIDPHSDAMRPKFFSAE